MKSRVPSIEADELGRLDQAVQSFEAEWSRDGEVELEGFWLGRQRAQSNSAADSLGLLAELIKADLRCRFARGQTPAVAGYLDRFPELKGANSYVLSLIYEEFCLNEELGRAPDVESFCDRYPEWKDSLASQLRYHRLISKAAGGSPAIPQFPVAGDDFEEFHLVSLLGMGGTSRVFLARDLSLGGKQVVLKVSLDRGQEPKVQGPLDHRHIIPVNSVTFQPDRQLRGLSMPFRVGLSLDEIITRANPAAHPRKAIVLWHALLKGIRDRAMPAIDDPFEASRLEARQKTPTGDGWHGFPIRGSYVQGAAWIVMTVARALHYAHLKHTFHRDVKPANVLLTLQHGPQLFDFNLADSPQSADEAHAALHGGTLPYMAPEQIEAFLDPALWGKVEARADIYSLGLVFRELLTGETPELPPDHLTPQRALRHVLNRRSSLQVSARRINPAIPHALDVILAKCLTLSAEDRYPDAQALAEDLDRFLRRQPLATVTNPCRRERIGNWAARWRPALAASIAAVILATGLLYHPLNESLKPPIETLPAFLSAVDSLDRDLARPALDQLLELELAYPRSTLLRLYLSFALDANRNHAEAEQPFKAALADRVVDGGLFAWARKHPEFVSYIEEFAERRLEIASDRVRKDHDKIDNDVENDRLARAPYYELARTALRLAVKLNPDSPKIQRLLAEADEFFGDFVSATRRVDRSIDLSVALNKTAWDDLRLCHALRCRIEIRWARHLQDQRPLATSEFALAHIQKAQKHLETFRWFLRNADSPDQQIREGELLELEIESRLTSGEIEIELGHLDVAGGHLIRARNGIKKWINLAKSTGSPETITIRMNKRLTDDLSRLQSLKSGLDSASFLAPYDQPRPNDAQFNAPPDSENSSGDLASAAGCRLP